jgi:hypothetical protein
MDNMSNNSYWADCWRIVNASPPRFGAQSRGSIHRTAIGGPDRLRRNRWRRRERERGGVSATGWSEEKGSRRLSRRNHHGKSCKEEARRPDDRVLSGALFRSTASACRTAMSARATSRARLVKAGRFVEDGLIPRIVKKADAETSAVDDSLAENMHRFAHQCAESSRALSTEPSSASARSPVHSMLLLPRLRTAAPRRAAFRSRDRSAP